MGKKIPIKIDDTIAYAVLEIRFELAIDPKTLISKILPFLSRDFPKFEAINQEIPPALRENHQQFKFLPEWRFTNDEFLISIGKNVMQFEFFREYESWEKFGSVINQQIGNLLGINIINKLTRIGLRYSNVIKDESYKEVIDLNFKLPFHDESNLELSNINNRFEFTSEEINVNLVLASNAEVDRKLVNIKLTGLLIDVDVFQDHDLANDLNSTLELIDRLHVKEKYVFFNSLKQEFIDSRNPKYD